jgi:hypothetical protein
MILYVLNERPGFETPITKENAWKNFCALIDRLIIAMGGSMCTHAALAAATSDTVIEATLPYCRYRPGIYVDDYHVIVRRVSAPGKGAAVLDYVPAGIDPNADKDSENLPYAYAQSAIAALFCLYRREVPLDPIAKDALLVLLILILHPLAKSIDDFIAGHQGKDGAWFCSQLVTYCYDEAAKTDPAYKLHFPGLDKAKESLIEWLISRLSADSLASLAEPKGPARPALELASPEIAHAAIKLLAALEGDAADVRSLFAASSSDEADYLARGTAAPEFLEAVALAADHQKAAERILADAYHLLSSMGQLDPAKSPVDAFNEYKESLVMPADLEGETSLLTVGTLYDHS